MNLNKSNQETFLELNVLNSQNNKEISQQNETIAIDLGTDECSICLDEINYNVKKNIYILPCLHAYHESCIYEWFENKKEYICPICRKIFGNYPIELNEDQDNSEERTLCFGYIKIQTVFLSIYLILFWSIMFFAVVYSRN